MNQEEITNYIFLNDKEHKGDVAFVFGTYKALGNSVAKAVEIYKKGLVPKILFTGGFNPLGQVIESEAMAKEAMRLGVPEKYILTENKSTNTLENILFSIPVIEKEIGLKNIKVVIAIVKNYHARRALMTLKKHLPAHITIKASSYDSENDDFRKDVWFQSEVGKQKIMQEVSKIEKYLAKEDIKEL